jgi:TatD DNase family protein
MTGVSLENQNIEAPLPRFVDTHCHLDDDAFANDLDDVLDRASLAGVRSWITIGFEPEKWQSSIAIADQFPGMSFVLGVHPRSAGKWDDATASELARLIGATRPRAIGEIGIDLFRSRDGLEHQIRAFNDQLDLALHHDLPVVIHMRAAEPEVLDLLGKRSQLPPLLFHSFDGSAILSRFVMESNSLIGVGGLATRGKSVTIREQLLNIPLERMVLETDSPYLVPARRKGSRNTPEAIPVIARFLADLTGIDLGTIAQQTTASAERFFGRLYQS